VFRRHSADDLRYKHILAAGANTELATNKCHKSVTPVLRLVRPALRLIRLHCWVFRCLNFSKVRLLRF